MTLIGWFTEPNGGYMIDNNFYPKKDMIVYAQWGWKPQFNTAGGVITSDWVFPVQKGSSVYHIDKLPEIYKNGYTFDGWYLADGITKLSDGCSVDLSKGVDIDAHWTKSDMATVTFNASAIGRSDYTYEYEKGKPFGKMPLISLNLWDMPLTQYDNFINISGETIQLPYEYSFTGWEDNTGTLYDESDIVTHDMTLTARSSKPDTCVEFDPDGGSTPTIKTIYKTSSGICYVALVSGSTLNSLPGSFKSGYILEGWYTEKNGAGKKLSTDTPITGPVRYYAHWIPFSLTASDPSSLYTYGAEWSNTSGNEVTNQDGNLEWHTSSTESITSNVHIRFEINSSADGTKLPIGAVMITVPKYIWKDWDKNGTGSTNMSAMLPKYPNTGTLGFSYTEDDGCYIITNSKELDAGAGLDMTIAYSVDPTKVPNGGYNANGIYDSAYEFYKGEHKVTFAVDADLDGTPESVADKTLTNEMHVRNLYPFIYDSSTTIYYEWDSSWGREPDDANDYFYIRWNYATSNKNQNPYFSDIRLNSQGDGTVVYKTSGSAVRGYYVCSVTKHPISILKTAPANGIELTNTMTVYGSTPAGFTIQDSATNTRTVYRPDFSMGSYSKYNSYSTNSYGTKSSGLDKLLDQKNNLTLPWNLYYEGNPAGNITWNEELGTYNAPERTISLRDGVSGDVMYSSGSASNPFVWEPSTGNVILNDSDYTFKAASVTLTNYDSEFKDGTWGPSKETNRFSDLVNWYVRYKDSDEFVYYRTTPTCYIELPENVVGVECQYTTSAYKTSMNMYVEMNILPTARVRRLVRDDDSMGTFSVIKNNGTCNIWLTEDDEESPYFHVTDNSGGNNSASKNCYRLERSNTRLYVNIGAANQEYISFDVDKGIQDTPMIIEAKNYNSGGLYKPLREGTFYCLLPEGTTVDPQTIYGEWMTNNTTGFYSANSYISNPANRFHVIPSGLCDIQFEQNYKGSGQTMMTIKYTLPEDAVNSTDVCFHFKLHNTYENILEHGTMVKCEVAYVCTSNDRITPSSISGTINEITNSTLYESLDKKYEGYIGYSGTYTDYVNVSAYSWGFDVAVRTFTDYMQKDSTLLNNFYTYRLAYSQSDQSTSQDLVFYDFLENGADIKDIDGNSVRMKSAWHGTFEYINIGEAGQKLTNGSETVHCKPIIYYSTKDRTSFTDADRDLSKKDVWTTTIPVDKQTITAVAVDCSKNEDGTNFVMKGKESLNIYITMRAPKTTNLAELVTYNEGQVWARHETDVATTPQYGGTAVTLKNVEIGFHKTSTPENGTIDTPVEVFKDDELTYMLSVHNPSDIFTLNTITLEDIIPDGCEIDTKAVSVHFGDWNDAVTISSSPRANMKKNGQTLNFTISSLLPGETLYIQIPTIVQVDTGILSNEAKLTSINGVKTDISSETLYHVAKKPDMAVKKTGVGGKSLMGASMQILDANGTIVAEWVTDGTTAHFDLPSGDYTIHEVSAPDGYFVTEDLEVHLSNNGVITSKADGKVLSPAVMIDDWTKISVQKYDVYGIPLVGASLEIYQASDIIEDTVTEESSEELPIETTTSLNLKEGAAPVDSWVSNGTAHEILGKLKPCETYVLVERTAPEGYGIAKPIKFVVPADGSILSVEMTDPIASAPVVIEKIDPNGDPIAGATLKVSRIDISESNQGILSLLRLKQRVVINTELNDNINWTTDETFEPIIWTTDETGSYNIDLAPGSYMLEEISAPEGYIVETPIQITIDDYGNVTSSSGIMNDDNKVIMMDDWEYQSLTVTKIVKGGLGNKTKKFLFRMTLTPSNIEGLPSSEVLSWTWLRYFTGMADDSILTQPGQSMLAQENPSSTKIEVADEIIDQEKLSSGYKIIRPPLGKFLLLTNGVCEFSLAHGETINFNLPYGVSYKIEEIDAMEDGYEITTEGDEGIIGHIAAAATFTNTKESAIPTGFTAHTAINATFGIISLLLAALLTIKFIRLRRIKKQ